MDLYSAERQDQLSGEHTSGEQRMAEENARKNKFYGMFHSGVEHLNENHGDRNKMGNRSEEPRSGYDKQTGKVIKSSYE